MFQKGDPTLLLEPHRLFKFHFAYFQISELKRKAEQRLTQIKKTFGSQLEDKLGQISEMSENIKSLEEEREILREEMKRKEESANEKWDEKLREEKLQLEEQVATLEAQIKENTENVSN